MMGSVGLLGWELPLCRRLFPPPAAQLHQRPKYREIGLGPGLRLRV